MSAAQTLARTARQLAIAALAATDDATRRLLGDDLLVSLTLLENATEHTRLASVAMAQRIAQIETTLSDRSKSEKRTIVCDRLGLSRRRYFELKAMRKITHC